MFVSNMAENARAEKGVSNGDGFVLGTRESLRYEKVNGIRTGEGMLVLAEQKGFVADWDLLQHLRNQHWL